MCKLRVTNRTLQIKKKKDKKKTKPQIEKIKNQKQTQGAYICLSQPFPGANELQEVSARCVWLKATGVARTEHVVVTHPLPSATHRPPELHIPNPVSQIQAWSGGRVWGGVGGGTGGERDRSPNHF